MLSVLPMISVFGLSACRHVDGCRSCNVDVLPRSVRSVECQVSSVTRLLDWFLGKIGVLPRCCVDLSVLQVELPVMLFIGELQPACRHREFRCRCFAVTVIV